MKDRRTFLKQAGLAGLASFVPLSPLLASNLQPNKATEDKSTATQWPDGSRLVVSVSMQFEAGGQPVNAESPFPQICKKDLLIFLEKLGISTDIKRESRECWTTGTN